MATLKRLLLIGIATAALAGCFAFHDDYPDKSCLSNADCFEAQGEVCDMDTKMCVVVDGGATPFTPTDPNDPAAPPAGDEATDHTTPEDE